MRLLPRRRLSAILPAMLCCASALHAAPPAPTERTLLAAAQRAEPRALALLEEIVNVNSGTLNFPGVRQVANLVAPHFEALGFQARWLDGAQFARAGHLIAERDGRGPHVLLIGHLDTVFEPNHPFQRFERATEEKARGPGTADMKGGIVVALTALRALEEAGVLDDLRLTVILHGDEEDAGEPLTLARQAIIDAAKAADIALGLENAADNPATAVIARRGYTGWRVTVKAESAHSSQIFTPQAGAGANFELARILTGFYQALHEEEYLTFNPGLIAGSTQVQFDAKRLQATLSGKDNIIAPSAVATGDLRTLSVEQRERAKQRMRQIVAAHLPQTSAQIEFEDSYPPMAPTDGNRKLLALYDAVSRDLGFGAVTAVNPRDAGAADVSFAADHVEMAIDGLGLLGGGAHTPEEFADLNTLRIQSQRLAVLLFRLGRQKPE